MKIVIYNLIYKNKVNKFDKKILNRVINSNHHSLE